MHKRTGVQLCHTMHKPQRGQMIKIQALETASAATKSHTVYVEYT